MKLKPNQKKLTAVSTALVVSFTVAQQASASMLLLFSESGSDVVLNVSGTLSLAGLSESSAGASLGGTIVLDSVNEQLQLGSGASAGVNRYVVSVENNVFASSESLVGTSDSWTSNTNSIRFQQNNGQILVDDAIDEGDILTVTSTHTFAGRSLSDFGLTVGETTVWLENTNVTGEGRQVIVSAIPELSSSALLGLAGMVTLLRRRRS